MMASFYAGYFAVMIVCMVIAIILAKNWFGWFAYIGGAVFQLISILGRQRQYSLYMGGYGMGSAMTPIWAIYIILLLVTAFVMWRRRSA